MTPDNMVPVRGCQEFPGGDPWFQRPSAPCDITSACHPTANARRVPAVWLAGMGHLLVYKDETTSPLSFAPSLLGLLLHF